MSLVPLRRPFLVLLLAGLVLLALVLPGSASSRGPDRIDLPDGFRPEGIAIGHGQGDYAFLGSLANGDIYRANLRTGTGKVISKGPGTPSAGLRVDRCGRLFVAGGDAGNARVVDSRSGAVLASYTFAASGAFVNDVVLTRRTAWFTDSQNPVLYGLPLGHHHRLPARSAVIKLPLDWAQVPNDFNANGITQTPDHKALLVMQTASGLLFHVDPKTGHTARVDLGSTLLTNGDGMLLKGRTLYVVQNFVNQVAVVKLNRAGTSGRLVRKIESDGFDVPTGVARHGGSLYLPNARFDVPQTPTTEYWVTRVDR